MPNIDELLEEALRLQGIETEKKSSPPDGWVVYGWFYCTDETVQGPDGTRYPVIQGTAQGIREVQPVGYWWAPPGLHRKFKSSEDAALGWEWTPGKQVTSTPAPKRS